MAKQTIKSYPRKQLTIEVDCSKCLSCGSCTVWAPQTFELDEKSMCQVKSDPIDSEEEVVSAAQNCAGEALTIIDNKTSEKLWPQ